MRDDRPRQDDAPFAKGKPTHSEDGVDLTLIRWMLSMTPAERLQIPLLAGQETVWAIMRLRGEKTET